jgi:hypothetical protein
MKKLFIFVCITLISLILVGVALAAGDYQITWWTVDNGGGSSQSADGQYTITGTIGQPDSGSVTGSNYAVHGGFWQGILGWLIHLPIVIR